MFSPRSQSKLVVVLTAVIASLVLTAGLASAAGSGISSLAEIDSANDGMGTEAIEWSGATWNADRNVVLTVDDGRRAYEFQLTADGMIDTSEEPRTITLSLARGDYEGVAWIAGDQYAFLSEDSGEVIIVDLPPTGTSAGQGRIVRTFEVAPGGTNTGPEGLATDGEFFYVTTEMPATVSQFTTAGTFVAAIDLTANLGDATGVAVADDGTLLVVSHESNMVAHYQIDWDAETAVVLDTRSTEGFTQLEGIALIGNTDVHLFGEDNTRKGNPGQTHSHLRGEVVVEPAFEIADLDCSGTVSIVDAIVITRINVGIMEHPGCGSGDVDGDTKTSVTDAIMITRCLVGIPNAYCPS